jgi:hypothetical protein
MVAFFYLFIIVNNKGFIFYLEFVVQQLVAFAVSRTTERIGRKNRLVSWPSTSHLFIGFFICLK